MHLLNFEQFELLIKNDISCTIHPELVWYEEKEPGNPRRTPCFTISCMVTNFYVPRNYLAHAIRTGCFQSFSDKSYYVNYSDIAMDYCLLEVRDKEQLERLKHLNHV